MPDASSEIGKTNVKGSMTHCTSAFTTLRLTKHGRNRTVNGAERAVVDLLKLLSPLRSVRGSVKAAGV